MRQRLAYEIEDIKQLGYPRVVKMTFELPYLDWCRFEKSELFHSLTTYLEELKKQEIQIQQKENQD